VSNPLGVLKRLYSHFGLPLESDAAANIYRTVEAKPNGGYGANRYSFADYGLDADEIREQFSHYIARFGTRPEPDRGFREPTVLTTSAELLTEPGE
jgi:hypothetical protein